MKHIRPSQTKLEYISQAECSSAKCSVDSAVTVTVGEVRPHSVEVMVYQYDKHFEYGCWMTSTPTMSHIVTFLGYSEFPNWLPWQPIQILQYPKSIQQNIRMWV